MKESLPMELIPLIYSENKSSNLAEVLASLVEFYNSNFQGVVD